MDGLLWHDIEPSPEPSRRAHLDAAERGQTTVGATSDSCCAQTGAPSETAASIAYAASSGMQYKNLIGAEIMRRRDRLGWSQSDLAVRLQLAGWDIDRSQVSKIECRLVHVSDFQQLYFVRIFKVSLSDLFPNVDPNEKIGDFLTRAMERERKPIPRGERRKTPNGKIVERRKK